MGHEAATHTTPRDLLEEAEIIPEATHEELAHGLGRILAWILAGRTLTKIGQRAEIAAAKIRPDLIDGRTLHEIAQRRGHGRSQAANLAVEFSRIFGIRGLNDKTTDENRAKLRAVWARHHAEAQARKVADHHLGIVNRFQNWRMLAEARGQLPKTPEGRARMRRELEPIARFLRELE